MPKTRDSEHEMLRYVLDEYLRIKTNLTGSPEYLALEHAGVKGFDDLLCLSDHDLEHLVYPERQDDGSVIIQPLTTMSKAKLRIAIALYHESSRLKGEAKNMKKVPFDAYNAFRVNVYDQNAPIVPWTKQVGPKDTELQSWKRMIRPSKSDFKDLKDETQWVRYKEHIETTLTAHELHHLIEPKFKSNNPNVDKAQMLWLYKVFQDIMKTPTARTIVTNHLAGKDTRKLWQDLCDKLDNSMTSELLAQKMSTYLASTRLHVLNWRGTQENFILHWKEQARIHNEINSKDKFSDPQLIRFLATCVAGTNNLATVLENHRTSIRAAGKSVTDITFDEYVGLLQLQAQVYDSMKTTSTNPRLKRSVNIHEFEFEGDEDEDDGYEAYVHDMDTPVDVLTAMNNETYNRRTPMNNSGPRKVMMNKETWTALSKNDQTAWDTVSDSGKQTILSYISKRDAKMNANQAVAKTTKKRDANPVTRSVNSHIFEPDDEDPQSVIEASVHEASEPNLIDLSDEAQASAKPVNVPKLKKDFLSRNFDINHMLSQPVKTTKKVTEAPPTSAQVREANLTYFGAIEDDDDTFE
jgi:hypothetical protein